MFFKKDSHNLLFVFGISFVILCMCKKNVSGFETNERRVEINEYFSSIRSIQADLNSKIDEFENFIHPRPGVPMRDTTTREDTDTAPATTQAPLPPPTPAPEPEPEPESESEPERRGGFLGWASNFFD